MANRTRQVQESKYLNLNLVDRYLKFELESKSTSRRHYDGEHEGQFVANRLNAFSKTPAKQQQLLRTLRALHRFGPKRTEWHEANEFLTKHVLSAVKKKKYIFELRDGVAILHPTTLEGRIAQAVLLLEAKEQIGRIKKCLHCAEWFYARFKHQQFCPDAAKRCQWNHYHSPEWRKKNRERNRKHQKEFRDRLFEGRANLSGPRCRELLVSKMMGSRTFCDSIRGGHPALQAREVVFSASTVCPLVRNIDR